MRKKNLIRHTPAIKGQQPPNNIHQQVICVKMTVKSFSHADSLHCVLVASPAFDNGIST